MSYPEQRRYKRYQVSLHAKWTSSLRNEKARISSLGLGGCFVETAILPFVGEIIYLDFNLPDGTQLYLKGIIVYILHNIGFGMDFGQLLPEQATAINQLVTSYTKKQVTGHRSL
jgi:hypothetical protein